MEALAHHALLIVAAAALVAAAGRIASLIAPRGLERVITAAPLAVALAVSWALVLGLGALGTNPVALALAAGATWLAVRRWLAAPDVSLADDVAEAWSSASTGGRVAVGALGAATLAYAAWVLRHPGLGTDAVIYHLPDVVAWIENGRPATPADLIYGLPVGNYPQANETALAWLTGISRGFAAASVWSLGLLALMVAAAWLGLRALAVSQAAAVLAVAAVCVSPLIAEALRAPGTDLPALTWLVVAAALVAVARQRPALLGPALVAGGLGIGSKTTVAPLVVAVLAVGFWQHRRALGPHRRLLLLSGCAAAVVGGAWYIRNLIGHGSPLWPLVELPWSDPLPELVDRLDYSLLDRPERTLEGNLDVYERRLAGLLALMGAALLAPLLARRRLVTWTGIAAALSLLVWLNAPFTGAGDTEFSKPHLSTVRYLLPAATAAALCLALAASRGGWVARGLALAALAIATGWSLVRTLELDYPARPGTGTIVVAGVLGALAVALVIRLAGARRPRPVIVQAAAVVLALGSAVGGALASDGYVQRHARTVGPASAIPFSPVLGSVANDAEFQEGSDPVAMAPGVSAMYAGDTLEHEVELIPEDEPCEDVEERAARGWVVIADVTADTVPDYTARTCFDGVSARYESGAYRAYFNP